MNQGGEEQFIYRKEIFLIKKKKKKKFREGIIRFEHSHRNERQKYIEKKTFNRRSIFFFKKLKKKNETYRYTVKKRNFKLFFCFSQDTL